MRRILFSFVLIAAFAMTSFAQMKDMPMKEHGGGQCPMMQKRDRNMMCLEHMRHIGLNDEQMNEIKPLQRELRKKHIRFEADRTIAEIELEEITEVKDFDLEKAKAATAKIGEMKTAHHLEMLNIQKEIRSILTDEQYKKITGMCQMPMKKGANKSSSKGMRKPPLKDPVSRQPADKATPKTPANDTTHQH